MRVEPMDERHGGFEIGFPSYVVSYFEATTQWTYRLTEVHNVHQAFAWADANAQGRRFILWAELNWQGVEAKGLLQLCGDDPFRQDDPHRVPPADLPAP